MSGIATPTAITKIGSVADYLRALEDWQNKAIGKDDGYLSHLWYRGVNKHFKVQIPGVYRPDFSKRSNALNVSGDAEAKRLHLEREVFGQFRTAGAAYLENMDLVDIYFIAQHYGMHTRLLDWSMNPLSGLFFACTGEDKEVGEVIAMDARKIIPDGATRKSGERIYQAILSMRHPHVKCAIGLLSWMPFNDEFTPLILPVRPDVVGGRIAHQGSCFTLHMHESREMKNPVSATIEVAADLKGPILDELHRLNINQFTIYADLDHLSKELRRTWGIK